MGFDPLTYAGTTSYQWYDENSIGFINPQLYNLSTYADGTYAFTLVQTFAGGCEITATFTITITSGLFSGTPTDTITCIYYD